MVPSLRAVIVEKARELGLNPRNIASRAAGGVSQAQLYRFFKGETDLTSAKLDAGLGVLGLTVGTRKR